MGGSLVGVIGLFIDVLLVSLAGVVAAECGVAGLLKPSDSRSCGFFVGVAPVVEALCSLAAGFSGADFI